MLWKLLRNILLLILLVIICDRTLGSILKYGFYHEQRGNTAVATYALKNSKEDLLIFGSSRASHHYVPQVFEDSLGLSTYNLGRDYMGIRYSVIMLKSIVERHQPQVIILDIKPDELFLDATMAHSNAALVSSLLPYATDFPIIRKEIKKLDVMEVLKGDVSLLYRFNSLALPILQHILGLGAEQFNGYYPLYSTMKPVNLKPEPATKQPVDPEKVELLRQFIRICLEKRIPLIITVSPMRQKIQYDSIELTKRIASAYGIEVWDCYSSTTTLAADMYFSDVQHLNDKGALRLSGIIAERMKTVTNF